MEAKGAVEHSMEKAVESAIDREVPMHRHSGRCMKLIRQMVAEGEETIMECKQSLMHSISPSRVIVTTKRLIIVKPSFWGLYLGHDIISPTEYSIIPYKNLISVIVSRGRLLSTIHLRIHGFTDSASSAKDEGEMRGIRSSAAVRLVKFLEEIIEYREDEYKEEAPYAREERGKIPEERLLATEDAVRRVSEGSSMLIWLGVEPVDYVSAILGVGKERILHMDTSEIAAKDSIEIEQLRNCIFVSYGSTMGSHMAHFLKTKYGVDSYVLREGIVGAARGYFTRRQ